jgi:hypothetical protein
MIPIGTLAQALDFFKSDRVKFIEVPTESNRIRGYFRLSKEVSDIIAFDGKCWDYDILVTSKPAVVPLYRQMMFRPDGNGLLWSRKIVIIDSMPLFPFKQLKGGGDLAGITKTVLMGYSLADKVILNAYWYKNKILGEAKAFLSPAMVKELSSKLIEASQLRIPNTQLKTKAVLTDIISKRKPFTISFSGRMIKGHRLDEIFKIMRDHWVISSGVGAGIECLLTTASKGKGRVDVPEWCSVLYASRDEFWDTVKTRSAVGVFLSTEEDYSMSLMEPIVLGLPVALYKTTWSVASLGEDYPFFVRNALEAYAVVKMFYNDYSKHYKKFAIWSRDHLTPLLKERAKVSVSSVVMDVIATTGDESSYFGKNYDVSRLNTGVINLLVSGYKVGDALTFKQVVEEAIASKKNHKPCVA